MPAHLRDEVGGLCALLQVVGVNIPLHAQRFGGLDQLGGARLAVQPAHIRADGPPYTEGGHLA